ncbi:aminoglycoside phosphotransferase family protein [Thomasclavelia sp.]|uniref:aminoglycoside phosphotransferase family protein n=1 Tax=Thomasclavelia sp. TaxID=3025757 RepID=UPI0025D987FE|nr:aminoglycoside phosphotransferase family protein [Thomasclavelia sp.]
MEITSELVYQLITEQFYNWHDLEITPVSHSGNDNRTFHLGTKMTVRLPSAKRYVSQIEKEAKWLPFLAKHLTLPISKPIAIGKPNNNYPYPWSINQYIEGIPLNQTSVDKVTLAKELAAFLKQLQQIDIKDAPLAEKHNFFRGANPIVYHDQVEATLKQQKDLPVTKLKNLWQQAIDAEYEQEPVWLHGDIAPGNLLIKNGHLCGVIDFGIMAVGDPACDYAMAWTYFDRQSRPYFLAGLDQGMIMRARGWALWKALITYDDVNEEIAKNAKDTINEILKEEEMK